MSSLPLVAHWGAEWPAVRQPGRESAAELPAVAPDAAARQDWQAYLPLAELPAGEQSEQEAPAGSGVADFLKAQIDAHMVKLELAVGRLAQKVRLLPDSAFVRAPPAAPEPLLEQTTWPPEIMLLCR